MKLETCVYSGYKIHPGHGKRLVRADGKINIFLNKKCERSTFMKRNPRDIPWTVLYRRKHKKGLHADDNATKKRVKRNLQVASRAIGDFSVEAILAKRNQNPEFRRAQREQAVKAAKDAARAQKAKKEKTKTEKAKAPTAQKVKATKNVKSSAPRVGGKR
ncbi:TRASH domain-containing protein [Aphelenchoides besseyi]|nr:TRASH domain-containing protein [Aphelenchoides besseyi]KAI6207920.1 TRASH domain-containing protein [Aphelenchoides besseyi]